MFALVSLVPLMYLSLNPSLLIREEENDEFLWEEEYGPDEEFFFVD
jgi:hypothetical protein